LSQRDFQPGFYDLCTKVRNRESRLQKADKIAYFLAKYSSIPLSSATCLDLGCSSGIITAALAPLFSQTIGLDYDEIAFRNIDGSPRPSPQFIRGDAMKLPFSDHSIDVIICAQVYEHVPDDQRLVGEMERVLKEGGIVFFSGPNRLFPVEPHYFLPFLHWLPSALANRYLRLLGRGEHYYERSRTLWSLRQLTSQFALRDVTIEAFLRELPSIMPRPWNSILSRTPRLVWTLLLPVFPNFNWVLCKPIQQNNRP
jgi:SAM-dependent methyltransferase